MDLLIKQSLNKGNQLIYNITNTKSGGKSRCFLVTLASNLVLYLYTNATKMKTIRRITSLGTIIILMASFSQCGNAQYTLEAQAPATVNTSEAYYQVIPPGIRQGDTHVKVVFPANMQGVAMDSIFFRGQQAKFEKENGMYVATLIEESREKISLDEGMSDTSKAAEQRSIPFELQPEACVVSFEEEGKVKYFKIDKLSKKELEFLPPMRAKNGGDKQLPKQD